MRRKYVIDEGLQNFMFEINITHLRENADAASQFLKALANSDRLLLLCQLSQGERTVSDLDLLLGIRQPTLFQQLAVLRREGVVETRRDGKHVFYCIGGPRSIGSHPNFVSTVLRRKG